MPTKRIVVSFDCQYFSQTKAEVWKSLPLLLYLLPDVSFGASGLANAVVLLTCFSNDTPFVKLTRVLAALIKCLFLLSLFVVL